MMLKKLLKLIRLFVIAIVWTYCYLLISNTILIYFWNFSTLSPNSWQLLKVFWEKGGIIKTGQDYLLLFSLLMLTPLWFWGFIRLLKLKYFDILFAPIRIYNDRIIRKYGADSKRFVLKNMGRSKLLKDEIDIKSQSKTQVKTDEEVNKIRIAISEKINSAQKAKK